MDNSKIETFCKKFVSYLTKNWQDNHFHIYVALDGEKYKLSCYGLGRAHWLGTVSASYPFFKELKALVETLPQKTERLSVEFFCGKVCKVEIS